MPSFDSHAPNSISWVDLAARDLQASVDFYCDLMGWTSFNDGETPYHIFMNGEAAVGGVMELTPEMGEMPPVWSVYVAVEDADATLAAAKVRGGSTMQEPFDVPDGGRIAVVMAPDEAVLCLFENGMESGLGQIDEIGAPCWFDTRSRKPDAAEEFYTGVFGWSAAPMDAPMDYRVLSKDDQPIAGIMGMGDMFPPQVPSHWAVSFSVADTDAAIEKTVKAGGLAPMPAMDTEFGRSANLIDPWGAGFMVIDRSSATAG